MKIRHRLIVALCLVGLVLGATTFAGFELFEDQAVSQIEGNVEETATLSADVVEGQIREQKERVAYLAARPPAREDSVGEYLESFVANTAFTSAHVVDENGTVTAAYAEPGVRDTAEEGATHANRTYFERSMTGVSYMSRVTCPDAGACRVRISAPVFAGGDTPGEVTGVLGATIPVGTGAFFSPTSSTDEATAVYVTAPIDGGADSVTFGDERGAYERSVTGTAPVASTDWTVHVEQNRAALDQTLRTAFYAQGLSLLIVLLSVATFGAWEYRTNLKQTERLLDGFTALRSGDYSHSLGLSAAEEWNMIDEQFDRLATTLADREAAVEEQKRRRGMLHRLLRHNLRNDINVILGQAELVPEHTDDEEVLEISERIRDTGWSLIDQADKARQLEQLMAEASETEPVELVSIIEQKAESLRQSHDVEVFTELPDRASVLASPLLPYAIEELFENAVEHNPSDPVIIGASVERVATDFGETVGGDAAGDAEPAVGETDEIRFRLTDNGPGIPDQDGRVLTGAEETSLEHGSGIGLRFVYWTVQQVRNSVEVSTDADGTTIDMLMPAAEEPSGEPEENDSGDENQAGTE